MAVAPGLGFGEHGEGFVRIALVENEQRITSHRNIGRFLASADKTFAQHSSISARAHFF